MNWKHELKKRNKHTSRKSRKKEIKSYRELPRWMTMKDFTILFYNAYKARDTRDIGHEHAELTFSQLETRLSKVISLRKSLLESCLWCCNLLSERSEFWHPDGLSFKSYVKRFLFKGEHFNETYNLILHKDEIPKDGDE